jgi:polyhydroxybutyrate depolymerase
VSDGDLVVGELRIGGRERGFAIRLPPPGSPAGRPVPLALVLHGNDPSGGGGRLMREWTGFDRQADTWGWAIAYPDGHAGCWADGRGVTTADEAGVDDVAFLRAVIEWSAQQCGTSPDRTVVAGMSNGAFMAHRLALEASAQVAVLAAVAGGLPAALRDLRPTHAVSAMLVHGTADELVPIGGGYSRRRGPNGELRGRTLSLRETAEHWRAIDRCPPEPDQTATTHQTATTGRTDTTEFAASTTTHGGVGGTRVVTRTIFGGGHTWPGPPDHEFDTAEEICRFADPLLAAADTRQL